MGACTAVRVYCCAPFLGTLLLGPMPLDATYHLDFHTTGRRAVTIEPYASGHDTACLVLLSVNA